MHAPAHQNKQMHWLIHTSNTQTRTMCRHAHAGTRGHAHTHSHTGTHRHADACAHAHARARTHIHTHTLTYIHKNTHIHTQAHTDIHTHKHKDTNTHRHAHTDTHTLTWRHTQTETDTDIHTSTQTCTNGYAHAHTHMLAYKRQKHTCTNMLAQFYKNIWASIQFERFHVCWWFTTLRRKMLVTKLLQMVKQHATPLAPLGMASRYLYNCCNFSWLQHLMWCADSWFSGKVLTSLFQETVEILLGNQAST